MKTLSLSLLLLLLCCLFYCSSPTNATSSQCRGPSTSTTSSKRGAVLSHMEEILESELLSLHHQGLNAEDMEYLAQLTTEQVNTLGFRRAFRRIRRFIRRIGRAIGRVVRGIFGGLFRRRAKEIIANSVANFNGFTGPNGQTLESRRPFIGGGAQRSVVSVASASVLRRRRGGFLRRIARIAKKTHVGLRSAARAVRRFGRSTIRKINEQSLKRGGKIGKFFSSISKGMAKRSMRQKMEALEKKEAASDGKPVNCVACRVDCMKEYQTLGGSMFTGCGQRYYYYGCKAVAPCFQTKTSTDDEIEGMIGICAYRNNCKFKNDWRLVGENQLVTDRLIGRIRGSGQNPE